MPLPSQGSSTNGCKRPRLHSTLGPCKLQRSGTKQSLQPELNTTGGCHFNPQTGHELLNSVLPDKVTSMAMQKGALTVLDLLFLTFQTFLPSEPSARVDGLNAVETLLRAAKNFNEALTTLRTWRQQILTFVTDLQGNPELLKLFNSLKVLISNLVSSDNSFATEVSQICRNTGIKNSCTDQALLQLMGLLEIEMSARAMEDDEERRRKGQANAAAAAATTSTQVTAATVGKGKGKGGGKSKDSKGKGKRTQTTVCQDYMTDRGCPRGDQCTFAHPTKPGKCLRCGGINHDLSTCRRPPRDPKLNAPNSNAKPKGSGGKGNPPPVVLRREEAKEPRRRKPNLRLNPRVHQKGEPMPSGHARRLWRMRQRVPVPA